MTCRDHVPGVGFPGLLAWLTFVPDGVVAAVAGRVLAGFGVAVLQDTRCNSVGILFVTRYLEVFIPSTSVIFDHSGFAPVGVYGEIYCGSSLQ